MLCCTGSDASTLYSGAWNIGETMCMAMEQNGSDIDVWCRIDSDAWFGGGDPAASDTPTYTVTGETITEMFIAVSLYHASDTLEINFGQKGFEETVPSGFKAISTFNLPAPAIIDPSKYFQTDIYTGTGAELVRTLTDGGGSAVAPDIVWIKDRDGSVEHVFTDRVRGATKELNPDSTSTVETTVAQGVKSFNSSGYTLGTDANYNASSSPNVAWCWVMNGTGASNEEGLINTDATSANTTAGQTIISYAGNATDFYHN